MVAVGEVALDGALREVTLAAIWRLERPRAASSRISSSRTESGLSGLPPASSSIALGMPRTTLPSSKEEDAARIAPTSWVVEELLSTYPLTPSLK